MAAHPSRYRDSAPNPNQQSPTATCVAVLVIFPKQKPRASKNLENIKQLRNAENTDLQQDFSRPYQSTVRLAQFRRTIAQQHGHDTARIRRRARQLSPNHLHLTYMHSALVLVCSRAHSLRRSSFSVLLRVHSLIIRLDLHIVADPRQTTAHSFKYFVSVL